ncbi:MAG: hypothetical protein U0401_31980 [Anaerolineae bacterium]
MSRGETLLYRGDYPAVAAELLLGDSCHHLADRSQGGLLLHAASLTWQDRGLLLPGTSGAGKTALTAWLLSQGFGYLTDELVFVPWGQNSVRALTRPLNLKRPARFLWETNRPSQTGPRTFEYASQRPCRPTVVWDCSFPR